MIGLEEDPQLFLAQTGFSVLGGGGNVLWYLWYLSKRGQEKFRGAQLLLSTATHRVGHVARKSLKGESCSKPKEILTKLTQQDSSKPRVIRHLGRMVALVVGWEEGVLLTWLSGSFVVTGFYKEMHRWA